jgi:hypothetical protein
MSRVKSKNKFFELIFIRSWWVFLFFLLSFIGYDQAIKKKNKDISKFKTNLCALENMKQQKKQENEELTQMINSQNDPAWIELVLMRDLGVVPDGKLKVHFVKEK